jgi:CheY-like chemotaxis protein
MDTPVLAPPHILILEGHKALQSLLQFILKEAGYAVALAFTLEAAWDVLDHDTFALILADLPLGASHPGSFTPAHQLRRRAHPTPVGLLMTPSLPEEEIRRAGFTFALPLLFDLDTLLGLVAATLQAPLSSAQERYVNLVERFLSALEQDEQQALLRLCTEDVSWYRLTSSQGTMERRIQGQGAVRTYLASLSSFVLLPTIVDLQCYAVPKGLVACYTQVWTTPRGDRRRAATTALFHFDGNQIAQIGMRPHLVNQQEQSQTG